MPMKQAEQQGQHILADLEDLIARLEKVSVGCCPNSISTLGANLLNLSNQLPDLENVGHQ